MQRRATTTIKVDDGLQMRPANTTHLDTLQEAFEETWPEVSRAMPWILPEKEIEPQLADFLDETERTGRVGRMHHWVLIRPWDEAVLGLLGFDRVTRSAEAEWNLGYWVRSSEQRRGVASRAIEAALTWIGELESVSIELKVDPNNAAGKRTVERTVRRWKGSRCVSGDSAITVAGVRTPHECHLITIGPESGPL
ncbi:MAG: GNAT family N-acetyltransferase [Candidatus Thalassarchaeum sp.]|nr:GNAT family N-acetyltransferase [Candidatus Thalassarchaeum sp.]MEC8938686.1 GNAT family N-acetyltransferase [Candidatus Thermoplasmatota archaeon]MED6312950.1 GNAT family N-acetyltransferase [Candidatus Thermoplasmatota archaeon]MEE3201223.1 GNAT family N-acetyltransferase [Candidatus Thermoplasmatota archaeon]MEE3303626.1 GNAT family N-acetyltransferase [Candidatus Thermoplasmatota archaeon]